MTAYLAPPLVLGAARHLFEEIVTNARLATGARLVHVNWLDPDTDRVFTGAFVGLGSGMVRLALTAVHHIAPGWNPTQLSFPVDVNPLNARIFRGGAVIAAPVRDIAAGTVPRGVLEAAVLIAGLRYALTCPLVMQGRVVGSLSFEDPRPFAIGRRRACEAFARQASLTLENAHLAASHQRMLADLLVENGCGGFL